MSYKSTPEIRSELRTATDEFKTAKEEFSAFYKKNAAEATRLEMSIELLEAEEARLFKEARKARQKALAMTKALEDIDEKGTYLFDKKNDAARKMEDLMLELEGDDYITDSIVALTTGER